MKCEHKWESVLDVTSPTPENELEILICNSCHGVKVHYKDINKKRTIKKPRVD